MHQEKVEQARANGEPIPDENEEAATNAANVNRSNRTTDSINTTIDYEVCDEDEEDLLFFFVCFSRILSKLL